MPKKSWKKLGKVDFKSVPLAEQVPRAVDVLRSANATCLPPVVTTSELYFKEMRKVLADAIWIDVKNAIAAVDGPEIPPYTIGSTKTKSYTLVKLNLLSLARSWKCHCAHWGPNNYEFYRALARCAAQRIAFARETLLSAPRDFWIALLMTDILAGMPLLLPKNWE